MSARPLLRTLLPVTLVAGVSSMAMAGPALAAPGGHGSSAASARSVSVDCVGDSLTGSFHASGPEGTALSVRLMGGHDMGHTTAVGSPDSVVLVSGTSSYSFRFDMAGRTERMFRVVVADAAGHALAKSRALPAGSCAPGSEVPESPAAALIPLTLLGTLAAAGAASARRRRAKGLAGA